MGWGEGWGGGRGGGRGGVGGGDSVCVREGERESEREREKGTHTQVRERPLGSEPRCKKGKIRRQGGVLWAGGKGGFR